jgi:hypothetical protein
VLQIALTLNFHLWNIFFTNENEIGINKHESYGTEHSRITNLLFPVQSHGINEARIWHSYMVCDEHQYTEKLITMDSIKV